jgi:hypothetical protein
VDNLLNIIGAIGFTNPRWFYILVPVLVFLVVDMIYKPGTGNIQISDLEVLRDQHIFAASKYRRVVKSMLHMLLVILSCILLAGPNYRSKHPLFMGGEQVVYQKFLLMLDISRSMSVPLGEEKNVSLPGQAINAKKPRDGEEIPRFEAARAALMDFVRRFNEAQIGLILFSAEPILVRWPTVETQDLFWDVLEENIGRGVISQTQSFSSLTNTNKALALAREVFAEQGAKEGAVILISDAEDDIENMGVAARNIRNDGIRLYTIGVGISEKTVETLSQKFAYDPGFRIFHVDSEDEMQEAYRLVAEVEESLPFEMNQKEYNNDLRWIISLALSIIAFMLFWILEAGYHQTHAAPPIEDKKGMDRGLSVP